MLFASSDNTATSLTTAILFILLNPQVHSRLVDVLDTVQADEHGAFPLQELEKLDFLVLFPPLNSLIDSNLAIRWLVSRKL